MIENKLLSRLQKNNCLLLDGGLSTTLEYYGHTLDKTLWSANTVATSPLSIVDVHEKFIEAGCDIITTASYQMSFEGFLSKGYSRIATEQLMLKSTSCALTARENKKDIRDVLIASSVGCYGAHLADGSEYSGQYGLSTDQLAAWHQGKFDILANSGCDIMACETVPCVTECKALCRVISSYESSHRRPELGGWITCSCSSGDTLNSGENFEDAIRAITDPSYERESPALAHWGVGVNCTSPGFIDSLLDIIRDSGNTTGRPIVVYPNKGESWDAVAREWVSSSGYGDAEFAEMVKDWRTQGANVIGVYCVLI
mmetsp:Transcript_24452/g.35947  ORF Transcript_24452/g.35947 Transcript_24452/m.35947 type:complete len:313 (-) Transcript_24452:162-1100(-)